jgi:hypothetical protein
MSDQDVPRFERDDGEIEALQRELAEAHKTIRTLLRQLGKAQSRQHEATRAHKLTVSNLLEATRHRPTLLRERDEWRLRAEQSQARVSLGGDLPDLTPDEARAIHRAVSRLYQDDGRHAERMKLWDALLEAVELDERAQ